MPCTGQPLEQPQDMPRDMMHAASGLDVAGDVGAQGLQYLDSAAGRGLVAVETAAHIRRQVGIVIGRAADQHTLVSQQALLPGVELVRTHVENYPQAAALTL